jgi:uncharacterized protein
MPSSLRTFILKVANRCNIDCDYCYVFNLADQTWRGMPVRMGIDVATVAGQKIGQYAEAHSLSLVHVVLHGGEPLLVGPAHLGRILEAVQVRIPSGTRVSFEVQTNGMLITPAWLDFFERFSVTVGVSLDGPPTANDRHRLTPRGGSTAAEAVRGLELLRSRPHLFAGILSVVDLANDPAEVHHYLAAFEPPVIDFNLPHATHDDPPARSVPNGTEYGHWLARVYDAWLADPNHRHTVRMLEDIIALSHGVQGSVESLGLAPPGIVVVESNGAIESVDTLRAVESGASQLGLDVFRHTFDDAARHPKLALRQGGRALLADQCQRCSLVEVCGGGYLPHRFSVNGGYRHPSVYCRDLEYLIAYVQASLRAHAGRVSIERTSPRGPGDPSGRA